MNIKYMYVRNEWKNRDVTIVSDLIEENDKTFVKFAWTFRHKNDKFIKREGRKVAFERLQSNDPNYSAMVPIESGKVKFFEIAVEILDYILNNPNTPEMYKKDIFEDKEYFYFQTEENQTSIKERWKTLCEKTQLV